MRILIDCEVVSNDEVVPDHFRMRLLGPDIGRAARAGQFCMVEVSEGLQPFLRRPLCFERISSDGVTLLYKVSGEGTRLLSRKIPGQKINVQGPLGNGFPVENDAQRHIIVSGGIGVATFPALADALVHAGIDPPEVILAARTRHLLLCADEFREIGCTVRIATDDGSAGAQLNAAQMLEELSPGSGDRVYVCGPMIMMKACSEVALAGGAGCLVSLEARMACGDGACLGCVVESKHEQEGEKMVRVCADGPVFDTAVIDWDDHDLAYDE